MTRLSVVMLILALTLVTFAEASRKPHSQLQGATSRPGTNRGLEPHQLDQQDPASHHRRQLGAQGPPYFIADLSKKYGPRTEEEEEAYGWMDFGRRSAEEDQHP